MAKTELVELESKVKKTLELKSLVKKDLVLESLITGSIESVANIPPVGTLTLNSIVKSFAPGEVLFDFTASDPDGTVAKIELLRKEAAEGSFTEVAEILTPAASGQITDLSTPGGIFEYKLLITDNEGLFTESNVIANVSINAGLIVNFDFGVPKVYADNENIPGYDFVKARKFGATAKIEQTATPRGKITTTIGADTGYFIGKTDLKPKGTWLMSYKLRVTAVGGQMDVFINDGEYSGNGALEPSTYLFGLVLFFTGDVRARFRPSPGVLSDIGPVLNTYNIGAAPEVICSIGENATHFLFDFDGATTSLLKGSVQSHTQRKAVLGECCNGTFVTAEFRNITDLD